MQTVTAANASRTTLGRVSSIAVSGDTAITTGGDLNQQGAKLSTGGDLSVQTGDLTVQGSNVQASQDVTLSAAKNVNIVASTDTESNRSTNSSSSASVGLSFGVGSGSAGFSVDVAASRGKGQANSDSTTYNNSQVIAGNAVNIQSGADTNLKGGNVAGQQVAASVGGNLNIVSLKDVATSNASQSTTGIAVSVPIGPGNVNASVSQAKQNSNSNYQSVNVQSGIQAGDSGFQIDVKGNTDLKGGLIASTDKAVQDGKNTLSTGTLTTSDLQNSMSASASSSGVSVGTKAIAKIAGAGASMADR